jgi:hypothetical protein
MMGGIVMRMFVLAAAATLLAAAGPAPAAETERSATAEGRQRTFPDPIVQKSF